MDTDVTAVLPSGFGKSILFHLLSHLIPVKTRKNRVIVVCPLNSIIEDQIGVLLDNNRNLECSSASII